MIVYNKDRSGVGLILNFRHSSSALIIRCASYTSGTQKSHSIQLHSILNISNELTKMSTLHHESLLETCFEEALEEIGIKEDSPFYADAYKTAQVMAMDKFLGMAQ